MTITTPPPLPHSHTPGSARAAFSYRAYRLVFLGTVASSTGTWMQNVALGAYIQSRTGSGAIVGVMVFAQLGPLLFLSIPGGMLANHLPRREWLIFLQAMQLVFSLVLAFLAGAEASLTALFFCNLAIGVANALGGPALQASIPMLVDRRDIGGAIALSSTGLNGSRVIGPIIVGILGLWGVTESQVFGINALTYLFMIVALAMVPIPDPPAMPGPAGWRRLTVGVTVARRKATVGHVIVTMTLFSLFSLPFVGLFPTVADLGLGIAPRSATYKWLYAVWGLGAALGALSAGTVLARWDKARVVRPALAGFAASLAVFGLLRVAAPAFPVAFVLGFCYFLFATSMLTVLQQSVSDSERAPVMALWAMAFGGTVPIGNLIFGPVMDGIGPRWILIGGAVFAVGLAAAWNLRTTPGEHFAVE